MSTVKFKNLTKTYDNKNLIIDDFNLDIGDGEFVVLLGESGCGKSTLLRMLAGLEDISSGEILIDDSVINDLEPKDRDIAMIFQNYALYPHMTVYKNIAMSLILKKVDKKIIDEKVREVASLLKIDELLDRKPRQLSGGQMQRVALARAMVRKPRLFLMDEPLSNLDTKLRVSTRYEIMKLYKKLKTTTIYVTHDQVEAMTMATTIVLMKDGKIMQKGCPDDMYNRPEHIYVAKFIGSPQINLLSYEDMKFVLGEKFIELKCESLSHKDKFEIDKENSLSDVKDSKTEVAKFDNEINNSSHIDSGKTDSSISNLNRAKNIVYGIRAQDISIENGDKFGVDLIENLGNEKYVYLSSDDNKVRLVISCPGNYEINPNLRFDVSFDINSIHCFDKETGYRI